MKIAVQHTTIYRYTSPVLLAEQIIRLYPRSDAAQRVLEYQLHLTPQPAGTAEFLDQDGKLGTVAWFSAASMELRVECQFRVETLRLRPLDGLVAGEAGLFPFWYPEMLNRALWPYRDRAQVGEAVRQYADALAAQAGGRALGFLLALNQDLYQSMRHIHRPEGPAWTSEMTFRAREGSCRDLAVLFCDACRTVGMAARFVSGYETASAGRFDASMHAWAEVYLPRAGWRGFDPSRGILVADRHIAVAAAADPALASPVDGSYDGYGNSHLDVYLNLSFES